MKVVIINDTSEQSHFGCQLVMQAYRNLCDQFGMEIIYTIPGSSLWRMVEHREKLNKADLIIVNGEGSIHNNMRVDLFGVANHYPSVLINTTFQKMTEVGDSLKNFLYISCREDMSRRFIEKFGVESDVTPDVIFSHKIKRTIEPTKLMGFTDSSFNSKTKFDLIRLTRDPASYIKELSTYKHLVIGRFHAICLAMMLEIPFSAYNANTWKNLGIMKDVGLTEYFRYNIEDAETVIPNLFPIHIKEYTESAPIKIRNMFEKFSLLG